MSRGSSDQILELPLEGVELAQQISESILDCPKAIPLASDQRAELERRWIAFQRSPDEGEPWEDVMRVLLNE